MNRDKEILSIVSNLEYFRSGKPRSEGYKVEAHKVTGEDDKNYYISITITHEYNDTYLHSDRVRYSKDVISLAQLSPTQS